MESRQRYWQLIPLAPLSYDRNNVPVIWESRDIKISVNRAFAIENK